MTSEQALRECHSKVFRVFTWTKDDAARQSKVGWANPWEHWASWAEIEPQIAAGSFNDDCDGFALAVHQLMRQRGFTTHLVFCLAETGEGHLVCATPEGMVADNRYSTIVTNTELEDHIGYRFISRSAGPGEPWKMIGELT